MIELKDAYIHCGEDGEISNLSVSVANGSSLLVYGGSEIKRHYLIEALLGLRAVAQGYLTYDGEVLTPAAARYMRRAIGYVPAYVPQLKDSLNDMVSQVVRLDSFKRYRTDKDHLIDLWKVAGVTPQVAATPCTKLPADDMQTGMLCMARWLGKQIVIVEEVAGVKTAQMLKEIVASGTLVVTTAPDNKMAEYFDNNINIEKL